MRLSGYRLMEGTILILFVLSLPLLYYPAVYLGAYGIAFPVAVLALFALDCLIVATLLVLSEEKFTR